jgi:VCBS repeat-containing protein
MKNLKLIQLFLLATLACSIALIASCKKNNDDSNNTTTTIVLSPTSKTVTSDIGTFSINVTAPGSWTATSNQSWCLLLKSSGTAHDSIVVYTGANSGSQARTATITVTSSGTGPATFVLTQNAPFTFPYICTGKPGENSYFPVAMNNKWAYGYNYYVSYAGRDTIKIFSTAIYNSITYFKAYHYNPQAQNYYYQYFRLDNVTQNVYEYYNGTECILVPGTPTVGQDLGTGCHAYNRKVSSISATVITDACTYTNCLAIDSYNSSGTFLYTDYYKKGLGFIKDLDTYLQGADLH